MLLSRKRYRRIILLTGLLLLFGVIYYLISRKVITIDPFLIKIIGIFFTFILSLLIATIVVRFTGNKVWNMFEKEMEVEQRIIISKLYSISLYSIAFIITFWKAGVSLGNITIFAGLIATGFAFAVREILMSFFAWFIILNKKPFHMGDYIHIQDVTGLVTRIGTFFFTLEQHHSNEYLKIPNSLILSRPIHNLGSGKYREELKVRLCSIPADVQERLIEVSAHTKARNSYKESVKAQLSADNDGWYISISYYTSYKQENLKPVVLVKVQELFTEHLKISS